MRTHSRVAVVCHATEVAIFHAGQFEIAVADCVVSAAGEAVEHVFLVGGGGLSLVTISLDIGGGRVRRFSGQGYRADAGGVRWAGEDDMARLTGAW